MTTTKIKDSVYKAIDVIVEKRIEDLRLDKTIKANIIRCLDADSRKYKVSYGGGEIIAFAQSEESYLPNVEVYILIPEGNFNNKKWIVGRTSTLNSQTEQNVVASALDNYGIVGNNIISVINSSSPAFYLTAKPTYDANYLYSINNNIDSALAVNTNALEVYKQEAQGLLISANFTAALGTKQQRQGSGDYGLIFNLRFKNYSNTYPTIADKWKAIEPKSIIIVDSQNNVYTETIDGIIIQRLNTFRNIIEANIINITNKDDLQVALNKILPQLLAYKSNFDIKQIDETASELILQYVDLISYLASESNITLEELKQEYDNWFNSTSQAYQENVYSYVLDTTRMIGNPYNFNKPTYQYLITDIDMDRFIGIDSIIFYQQNFLENASYNNNLKVDSININLLRTLDNINGDYKLSITTPDGTLFDKNTVNSSSLSVYASIFFQKKNDITPYCNIMWFKKDPNITSPMDEGYNPYAKQGWKQINDYANNSSRNSFITTAEDNINYQNIYKVIAQYNLDTILQQEFTIYNQAHKHDVELESNAGTNFGFGAGAKTITCKIDGLSTFEEDTYTFTWFRIDSDNTSIQLNNIKQNDEIKNQIDIWTDELNALSAQTSLENLPRIKELNSLISKLQGINFKDNPNQLEITSVQLQTDRSVTISCMVYKEDAEIGSAEITFTAEEATVLKDYTIEIVNGEQVFQYSESGVSPASVRNEDPIEIRSLSCNFYDINGGLINPINYTVTWQYPITNTLIDTTDIALGYDSTTELEDLLLAELAPIKIKEDFNYLYTNNQIICNVNFQGATYRKSTSFLFEKIGNVNTNGTDIVGKISPIENNYNSNILLTDMLSMIIDEDNNAKWNTGSPIDEPILDYKLYRRNVLIDPQEYKSVKWDIAHHVDNKNKTFTINGSKNNSLPQAIISYKTPSETLDKYYTNQIIQCKADLPIDENTYQSYYGFYPIPSIKYNSSDITWSVGVDKDSTLREVVYNSDGRIPLYDKNRGVGLRFRNISDNDNLYLTWSPHGGEGIGENHPAFALGYTDGIYVCSESKIAIKENELKTAKEELYQEYYNEDDGNLYKTEFYINYLTNLLTDYNTRLTDINNEIADIDSIMDSNYENLISEISEFLVEDNQLKEWTNDFYQDLGGVETEDIDNILIANTFVNKVRANGYLQLPIYTEDKLTSNEIDQLLFFTTQILNIQKYNSSLEDRRLVLIEDKEYYDAEIIVINEAQNNLDSDSINITEYIKNSDNRYIVAVKDNLITEYNQKIQEIEDKLHVYSYYTSNQIIFNDVIPNDVYSCEYLNTYVKINIYEINEDENQEESSLLAEIIVPIHMVLNTYGLASINAWDGNSVKINEEDGYVLAPQIGAGVKHATDNTFTGILMGTEKTYDDAEGEEEIGLLGYSHGKRSIFLDAATGNATFGLPEDDAADLTNPLTEGRIELRPGGTSSISKWNIDSRSIYRVVSEEETEALENRTYPYTEDAKLSEPYKVVETINETTGERQTWGKAAPKGAHGSIPSQQQGILLSALPAYASFKGRPLSREKDGIENGGRINFDDPNVLINPGDSFELEINPNDWSLFTIYAHINPENREVLEDGSPTKWYREPRVGIDASGRFYTNSIRDQGANLNLGYVGGFGKTATQHYYLGASIGLEEQSSLIKYFTYSYNRSESEDHRLSETSPLFLSSNYTTQKEGIRPLRLYGDYGSAFVVGDNKADAYPEDNISKIEFTEEVQEEYIPRDIILSSMYGNSSISKLVLESAGRNRELAKGSLEHTGSWQTKIDGEYTGYLSYKDNNVYQNIININENKISFINNSNKFELADNSIFKSNAKINITSGSDMILTSNDTFTIDSTHNLKIYGKGTQNSSEYHEIFTSGGKGLFISTYGFDSGNSAHRQYIKMTKGTNPQTIFHNGNCQMQLEYATDFRQWVDTRTTDIGGYINQSLVLGTLTNDRHGVAERKYIIADGDYLINTCDGGSAGPIAGLSIDTGHERGSIVIPRINVSHGRPSFTNQTLNIDVSGYAYSSTVSNLSSTVNNLQTQINLKVNKNLLISSISQRGDYGNTTSGWSNLYFDIRDLYSRVNALINTVK